MFNLEYFMSLYCVLFCFFMFGFYYKNLMLMIISLEFIMITLIYNMFLILMNTMMLTYMMLFMLTFSVCEGALVLTLVVMMVRFHGNDYINSLMILKW